MGSGAERNLYRSLNFLFYIILKMSLNGLLNACSILDSVLKKRFLLAVKCCDIYNSYQILG